MVVQVLWEVCEFRVLAPLGQERPRSDFFCGAARWVEGFSRPTDKPTRRLKGLFRVKPLLGPSFCG